MFFCHPKSKLSGYSKLADFGDIALCSKERRVIELLFLLFYNLVITALLNSDLNTKTVS